MAIAVELSSRLNAVPLDGLVAQLKGADEETRSAASQELLRRFAPLMRRCWPSGILASEYADFVQDVFLGAFRGLSKLRRPSAFAGYVASTVRSVAVGHLRRELLFRKQVPLDPVSLVLISPCHQEMLMEASMRSSLRLLHGNGRTVLELELGGLTPAEIMHRTGLTRGGVDSAKSRAIQRLRRHFGLNPPSAGGGAGVRCAKKSARKTAPGAPSMYGGAK